MVGGRGGDRVRDTPESAPGRWECLKKGSLKSKVGRAGSPNRAFGAMWGLLRRNRISNNGRQSKRILKGPG